MITLIIPSEEVESLSMWLDRNDIEYSLEDNTFLFDEWVPTFDLLRIVDRFGPKDINPSTSTITVE